ncbi:MAG: hypothetical protein RDU01_03235 [Thermodesulfovibrionales bacterium]|nr:hypothetical protein [Thermodesulfovibrionales bacterium]
MNVFVNDTPVVLAPGMTVRHALTGAGVMNVTGSLWRVYDEWGNELGLDGALSEGARIYVRQEGENPVAKSIPD